MSPKTAANNSVPANATSPTESSAECGETNKPEHNLKKSRLDKGASGRPPACDAIVTRRDNSIWEVPIDGSRPIGGVLISG